MRRALRTSSVVYLGLVLAITCWPSPERTAAPRWIDEVLAWCAAHGVPLTFDVAEALANVVMFAPFGLLLTMLLLAVPLRGGAARPRTTAQDDPVARTARIVRTARTAALVVAGAACFSAAIETVQRLIPGRVPTVQDVVLNTTGAATGVVLVIIVTTVVRVRSAARISGGRASPRTSDR